MQLEQFIQGNIIIGSENIHSKLSEFARLHTQSIRNLHITVEVLDEDNSTIDTIQGLATTGSLSVDGSSLIRRTGSISFVLLEKLLPKKDSLLWLTNRIRVYAGIEDMYTAERTPTHFCLGTFYITEPNVNVDKDNRSIDIDLQDMMMRWEEEELENSLVIPVDVPIGVAMTETMELFGEKNFNIEMNTTLTVPYDLEFNAGQKKSEVIAKIKELYTDWEAFYDTDGTFVFKHMDIQKKNGEPIAWTFANKGDLQTSFKESYGYRGVRNKVKVIGQMNTLTGITPIAESVLEQEDSPFLASEIGVKTKVIVESSYATVGQCESRARYELFKCSNLQESLSITSIPIYFLDANDIIKVENPVTKEVHEYIIDSLNFGLGVDGTMSIEAHKAYYDEYSALTEDQEYLSAIETIKNGINTKGWLSLGEKAVRDYYGLQAVRGKLIVQFIDSEVGGLQAETICYKGSLYQVLKIDVRDFMPSAGDSGDNGTGKEGYTDRILGHEMVHAVMNNVYGFDKVVAMPDWFKEGSAELIHGADERLKKSITTNNAIDNTKLNDIITMATNMLNNRHSWAGVSDEYSASYLIMSFVSKKLRSDKKIKDFYATLKETNSTGTVAIKEAIVANTIFNTYESFVSNFSSTANNFVKNVISLNLGKDEVDTGSIGGSDHEGTKDLNAENVFDNSTANSVSIGFEVSYS